MFIVHAISHSYGDSHILTYSFLGTLKKCISFLDLVFTPLSADYLRYLVATYLFIINILNAIDQLDSDYS